MSWRRSSKSLKGINAGGIIAPAHGACSSMAEYLTVEQVLNQRDKRLIKHGARSSMAERLPVEQDAAGSSPAEHPWRS